MENLLQSLRAHNDRTYKVIIAGYLLVLVAVGLALTIGEAQAVAPFAIGLVTLCILLSLGLFAAHHLSLVVENRRLSHEGASLDVKAHSDPLTGLMNRVAFNNVLAERSRDHVQGELAILFFDLNRFKEINDSLGHKVGDLLLGQVALCLTENLPGAVSVARMGGDEFAAILPVTREITPEACATAIADSLKQPFLLDGQLVQTGTAIGIAYGNLAYDDGDDLLKRADLAMYEAKSAGMNTYRVFDDVMEERMSTRVAIRSELTKAMAENELALHFQPLVSARTGELKSVEALLRWRSPRLGNVSPAVLIPIAEESGQIIELSNWVIDRALEAAGVLGDVPVGINISPLHFRHSQFAQMVADKMLAAKIKPSSIYIEITEGVLISHMEAAKRTISQLRTLGIKVYLDDFGTGYSSLSYLQNFEFDGMKIDKSFLRNLDERQQATQIMRSVIDLGHSLNLQVVAEGVETDWQARLLQLLNCDLLQGFHFATPMPLADVIAFREANDPNAADATLVERRMAI